MTRLLPLLALPLLATAAAPQTAPILQVAPHSQSAAETQPAAAAQSAADAPAELGAVRWGTDVDAAFADARARDLPVLILFQEIPGCATCVAFGGGPLSHPLLVDAIEHAFVPVAVNNRPTLDDGQLARFGEPAWNNPVVRLFAADGSELLPRRDGIWDAPAIARRLVDALSADGRAIPDYLALAEIELRAGAPAQATYSMACYWSGEAALGALDGVVATEAGWQDGREVVTVRYRGELLAREALDAAAAGAQCTSRAGGDVRAASDDDRKYHLRRSALAPVPLSEAQAARVNADLARGHDGLRWLSPTQRAVAAALADDPKAARALPAVPGLAALEALAARLGVR